jgi:predicted 2-oxoglutarate/Fe(II)-dependent dioxygenase YbiX
LTTTSRFREGTEAPRIFLRPEFLDPDMCRRIRRAMDAGVAELAEVLDRRIERQDAVRRASSIEIDPAAVRDVEARLDAERDAIGAFHGVSLAEREGAGFLRYADGGFYRPHRDRAEVPSWPDAARRRIAVVVFLNGSREAGPGGDFTGGALRLFAGDDQVDVTPRTGLLVAFPADLLHEVTVVRAGTRDAIVDWFYGDLQ